MLSFEATSGDGALPDPEQEGDAFGDRAVAPRATLPVRGKPDVVARMLKVAAVTANQLVTRATAEAESLMAEARATARLSEEASRREAADVSAELSRARADLDRERAAALEGLAEEKAGLETQIAALRQMEAEQRDQLRRHLSDQLAQLDATSFEPTSPDAD
jgi:hypothetical protein